MILNIWMIVILRENLMFKAIDIKFYKKYMTPTEIIIFKPPKHDIIIG